MEKIKYYHWHRDCRLKNGVAPTAESTASYIEDRISLFGAAETIMKALGSKGPRRRKGFTVAVKGNKIGIAVCSKKDQFIKKRGRLIAEARLEQKPIELLKSSGFIPKGESLLERIRTVLNKRSK